MAVEEAEASENIPLPPVLQQVIDNFNSWVRETIRAEQDQNTIKEPLYHYTDGRGLKGVLESGQIWFTDYRHLNDPSELIHGINMAHHVGRLIGADADKRVQLFLKTFVDMFKEENFEATLEFFIASFSRTRDELGQWRAYADNGRGFAIGLSPSVFSVVDEFPSVRLPEFVGSVRYSDVDVCDRHRFSLSQAAVTFSNAVEANLDLMRDKSVGIPFMQEFARSIMALPLIWNCLTSKHPAYEHEREVRLVIMGTPERLSPHVTIRLRGSEIVPYIPHPMPIREPNSIVEVVVGPAAPIDAERGVRTLLRSVGIVPDIRVSRSTIPYRAL